MFRQLIAAIGFSSSILTPAVAGDISVFGGRLMGDTRDQNSVAVSIGFDVPISVGLLSPSELRLDIGYLFDSFVVPSSSITNPESLLNTDIGTVTAHAGPSWRLGALGRASVFAGVQAGVALARRDTEFVGTPAPDISILAEQTQTSFSYQIPVGFEYSFNKRVGITTRYRLIGFTAGGHTTDHIIEGGVILKF